MKCYCEVLIYIAGFDAVGPTSRLLIAV